MAVKFKDYYEMLGVPRTASQDEIKAAYRKLAKQYHPDVNKAAGAEAKFKDLGEAYEVLRDPEKRGKYDQLGADWRNGQEFRPPPGWGQPGGRGAPGGGGADFSDFFETLFGGRFRGFSEAGHAGGGFRQNEDIAGEDQEVHVRIPLEDVYHGAERTITLQSRDGRGKIKSRSLKVKIPRGVLPGQRIRLAGQGGAGEGRGVSGDLYLVVEIEPHSRFRIGGRDLHTDLPVAPWEAALGADIVIPTLDGDVKLSVPVGTSSGQKLRLRGKGLPAQHGDAGNLYVEIRIVTPKTPAKKERELWESLAKASTFDPRADW